MSDLKLTPVCKNSVGDEEKNTGHLTFCLKLPTTWCTYIFQRRHAL